MNELLEEFQKFLKCEEEDLKPYELLKKAYHYICKARPCEDTSTLRKEISGSLMGLGMKENRLDLLEPSDAIQFLEQYKEKSQLIHKQEKELELRAAKLQEQEMQMEKQKALFHALLKAEHEKVSSLELQLQELQKQLSEVRLDSSLQSESVEINLKTKRRFA